MEPKFNPDLHTDLGDGSFVLKTASDHFERVKQQAEKSNNDRSWVEKFFGLRKTEPGDVLLGEAWHEDIQRREIKRTQDAWERILPALQKEDVATTFPKNFRLIDDIVFNAVQDGPVQYAERGYITNTIPDQYFNLTQEKTKQITRHDDKLKATYYETKFIFGVTRNGILSTKDQDLRDQGFLNSRDVIGIIEVSTIIIIDDDMFTTDTTDSIAQNIIFYPKPQE